MYKNLPFFQTECKDRPVLASSQAFIKKKNDPKEKAGL
jgi:hypothetical protein